MHLRTELAVLAAALVVGCAVNPATGERQLSLVSEEAEIQMGREADPQITSSLGLVEDEDLQAYVTDVGNRLAAASERPDLPWSFKVVDEPIVNAFALPGGFIYVTRGILSRFASEAELAGVLGHEIGHVTARHSVNQISRQQLQQLGLGVGMILSEDIRRFGGALSAGLQLLNLSYSRGDESQSDELGLRYMTRLGYDPDAMIGVFQMLAATSGGNGEGRVPEWQLTHPYPENREQDMRAQIQESGISREGEVNRDGYLDHIDGLVYGDNPREGYFKGSHFYHPDLEFELDFPEGWQLVNQSTAVAAVEPSEQAVLVLQVAPEATDPVSALREFLAQEGMSGGPVRSDSDGGVERARAPFEATTEQGTVRGEAAFLRAGGDGPVYAMLGYGSPQSWGAHAAVVDRSVSSFGVLTDDAVLDVEPWRLEIRTMPGTMSLNSYAADATSPVELEELAGLNRVAPSEVLDAGTRIKWVVGEPFPGG